MDCGPPDIPQDGILQLVGSHTTHTQYRDEIQFRCTSSYYTLKGDGKNHKFACNYFNYELAVQIQISLFFLFNDINSSFFQILTLAMPLVNGHQLEAVRRCQNALKVCFSTYILLLLSLETSRNELWMHRYHFYKEQKEDEYLYFSTNRH